jgi:CBS-domain-containing membrane protein
MTRSVAMENAEMQSTTRKTRWEENEMEKHASTKLTAADVMQHDIVTVMRSNTLRDAMGLLTANHVTGLPVMDEHSRCIGLISATDILNFEQEHCEETEEGNADVAQYYDPESEQWETIRLSAFALEEFGDVRVEQVMATDLIWVERETPIQEAAARMHEAGVHRVLVLDDQQQLYGIISSFDFVRLIAEGEAL